MYKILIISDCKNDGTQKIMNKNMTEYGNSWNLEQKIRTKEYELIYVQKNLISNRITDEILIDYIILPQLFKKVIVNTDSFITFINIQILNKLIDDNIKIIEFKNWYERIIVANRVQEIITKKTYSKKIPLNIALTRKDIKKAKFAINKVILRNYAGKNIIRTLKFFLKKKKIKRMFFDKIINNIENDVKLLEKS